MATQGKSSLFHQPYYQDPENCTFIFYIRPFVFCYTAYSWSWWQMVLERIPVVTGQKPRQAPSTSVSSPPNVNGPQEKSQWRTHSDVMRTCPHIYGWESNPKPAYSDVTVATTKSFLQAALKKYINFAEAFPQRRIEWRTSYGVNCTRNQALW